MTCQKLYTRNLTIKIILSRLARIPSPTLIVMLILVDCVSMLMIQISHFAYVMSKNYAGNEDKQYSGKVVA